MCCGQTVDHSSRPSIFKLLQTDGDLFTVAHYPQSNGKAESAVKSMKKIIRAAWNGRNLDEEKLCRALLQYRNTPCRKDGLSPAQKLYRQPVQDMLPAHRRSFAPQWQRTTEDAERQAASTRDAAQKQYNASARSLREIQVGSNVAVQNPRTKLWDTYGVVTSMGPYRQYSIKTSRGTIIVRKRRYLRRRAPMLVPEGGPKASQQSSQPVKEPSTLPRKSGRYKKPTQRLIEDPTWN